MDLIGYFESGEKVIVKNKTVEVHSNYGVIRRDILKDAKHGSIVLTSKDTKVLLLEPSFKDRYTRMKKGTQPIKLKECAAILAETLVGKDSVCFDCGAGMGGLSCFLARYVKKVYSMDNRPEHLKTAQENAENLGLSNITFLEGNIYDGIPVKTTFDLITLDVINPEAVIPFAKEKLKQGGFLVAYCPQATQMQAFCNALNSDGKRVLAFVRTIEIIERNWKVDGRICRPENMGLMHTGFLVFARNTCF